MDRIFNRLNRGFTLVELVVVMTILAILSVFLYTMLQGPIKMWAGLGPRAELTAAAEFALQRMTREIRLALPNSVRITGNTIEFLRTLEGGRYRRFTSGGNDLDLTANNDGFDVLGGLVNSGSVATFAGSAACINGNSDCLVIYNTGGPLIAPVDGSNSYNAYLGPGTCTAGNFCGNMASISNATATTLTFDNSDLASWHFPTGSPEQRFYIVDTPVSFVCNPNPAGGTINRHHNYAIAATQSATPGGTVSLLTDHVTACSFSYSAASSTRNGLVVLEITLTSDNGQSVTLMQQAVVSNIP